MFENLVGQTLDRYQVLSLIGQDELGVVFRAFDPTLQRDVGIKVLSPEVTARPGFSDRFVQVARTAARLDHPNLVQVFDFRGSRSLHYLVMEYIPGASLDKMLASLRRSGRWMLLGEAVHLVRQLSLAMEYVRSQGAPQRALGPRAVKIKPVQSDRLPYLPVLTDLGLAQLLQEGTSDSQTIAPAYLSPEGALGRPTSPRSDVYTLGVLLFELATGQLPFPVLNREDAIHYHTRQPLPGARSVRSDLPETLEAVIVRALEKNPEARYAGPAALANELEQVAPIAAEVKTAPPAYENPASLLVPYQESIQEPSPQPAPPPPPLEETAAVPTPPPGEPAVEAFLESAQLSVEAGGSGSTTLIVSNPHSAAGHFRISQEGLPNSWVTLAPQVIRLEPGEDAQVRVTIRPPRSPQTRAGRYPFTLHVVQQEPPGMSEVVRGTITVGAFFSFRSELTTARLRANEPGRVAITNQGNTQETFTINLQDPEGGLLFSPPQSQLRLEEGQTGLAEFRANMSPPVLFGSERVHPFRAQVVSSKGEAQTHSGGVVIRPFLPVWVIGIFLLVTLCSLTILGVVLGQQGVSASRQTAAVQAMATGSVIALTDTANAQTGTALALASANQATIQAVTATAAWMLADDDGDGLTNQQELDLGTRVDDADTDKDGLTDGEEVQLGTDPLRPDTDGDRILDGVEIDRGLNPLEADTDGDGLPDASDPSPAEASTATPDLQATQNVFLTQTAAAIQGTQAVVAQTQTAQAATAAALDSVSQTATAEAALATAQSAALTSTAAASLPTAPVLPSVDGRVAYIYLTNHGLANEFQVFLQDHGLQVDLMPQDAIPTTDFSVFNAVIVGPDTGEEGVWGDPEGTQANRLGGTGLPVMGLGQGGYAFFGRLGLQIGYDNGVQARGDQIVLVDPGSPIWTSPYPIAIPDNNTLTVYGGRGAMTAIVVNAPGGDLNLIGRRSDEGTHYPVLAQAGRYLLWGFGDGPRSMTDAGRQVFIDLIAALIP